ncbi:MAG: oxygenase MpaB family protein [Caulobacteraceae bacterium]
MARLPTPLQSRLEEAARGYFDAPNFNLDFRQPAGAAALFAPDSVAWRVMKNPIALLVGGVAAVILELAEPRVRTGVWERTTFRTDPAARIKRTGLAAMVTVYAPAETARGMIAGIVRAHERIEGVTPAGARYRANDKELLNWVHATAGYGFAEAYRRYVRELSGEELDRYYREGEAAAALYGAHGAPRSTAGMGALFASMRGKLERSDIIFEFLDIVRRAPILPSRAAQRLVVRGAVELTPPWLRDMLGLDASFGLKPGYETLLKAMGAASDRIVLESAPPAQACVRMGLPADYLYR